MPPSADDPTIRAEQAHLSASRAALRVMREETLALRAQGGNAVSTEVLQAAIRARAAALLDRSDVPLFFGRLDYSPGLDGEYRGERYYVGRRHVHDAAGDPMVVDWRAPVSTAFYRASAKDPHGLELRRRFGFSGGQLTAFEDEPLTNATGTGPVASAPSRILAEEIERPRVGPMRDIVATIQPEQDEIVRADLSESVCVQGAPGTGKTAVGLHRVAFLLYTHRDRLKRGGALVVGPNRQFLKYIEQVLPALGEVEVAQATVEELVDQRHKGFAVRGADTPAAARIKGDARMAEVLQRALWAHLSEPTEAVVVPRGSRIWRVPAYELQEQIAAIRERGVRYAAGRAMLAQRIAHTVLTRMESSGESPDDRVQDAVARSRPVKVVVDQVWPAVDPVKLLFALLSSAERLAAAAAGLLGDEELAEICWEGAAGMKMPRSPAAARWTLADAVLLDELADQIDRTPSLAHVVLDEAQDLSPMQCRAVGRRCATGSATVLGDVAQATTAWAAGSWDETLRHLGKPAAAREELTQGFRVPRQVIEYAARLLPFAAPQLAPPTSVRQADGSLELCPVDDVAEALTIVALEALAREGSIGVIAADGSIPALAKALNEAGILHTVLGDDEDEAASNEAALDDVPSESAAANETAPEDTAATRLVLVPASLAKGLEYDQVVVTEPADIVESEYSEVLGLRRLYVVLTRAVTRLTVLHVRPLPVQLSAL